MGADIHMYIERWTDSNDYEGPRDLSEERNLKLNQILEGSPPNFRWVSADSWEIELTENSTGGYGDYWNVIYEKKFYSGRNYSLFSRLADVRSYGEYNAISEPRGIPEDASFGYKYMCDQWGGDAHSHSYFTLKELLKYDWGDFPNFKSTLDKMSELDPNPSNVRCCFFFDN